MHAKCDRFDVTFTMLGMYGSDTDIVTCHGLIVLSQQWGEDQNHK